MKHPAVLPEAVAANTNIIMVAKETLFPEIVMTDTNGYKSVDYGRLTPILVEAIKEQQQQIDAQQQQINELKTMMEKLLKK